MSPDPDQPVGATDVIRSPTTSSADIRPTLPPTVSVVVPVYNSEHTLDPLVERLSHVLPTCTRAYEIILVDDGSRDASWDVVSRLASDRPECRGLRLLRNYGQHNALLAGIRQAKYEIIVTMDDDLQNPPEEVPRLLEAFATGADVIYGRPQEVSHSLPRRLSSRVTRLVLQNVMGADGASSVSPFRAFYSTLRDGFAEATGPVVNIDVLLSWSTTKYHKVLVRHDQRTIGRSNYTFRHLVRHTMNLLTGFSTQPLRLASMVGFVFTLTGIGIFRLCGDPLLPNGRQGAGFCIPGLDHCSVCWRPALHPRGHRRIPCPHVPPHDGKTTVRRQLVDAATKSRTVRALATST